MKRARRFFVGLLLGFASGFGLAAQDRPPIRELGLDEAVSLARRQAVSVRANAALADAAHRAVWTATSAYFPKISASATGAWLGNPPAGMSVAKGALGELPLLVPVDTAHGGTYNEVGGNTVYSGPLVYHPMSLPAEDWTIIEDAKPTYFKGSVTFTQPLVAWGKISAGVALASLEAEIAEIRKSGSELDAVRLAKRSYDAAILSRDSAAILGELCDLADSIVADRRSALEAGTSTKVELLSAQADLANLAGKRIEALEAEKSALESLGFLTGLDAPSLGLSSPLRQRLPKLDEDGLKKAAPAASTEWGTARARLAEAGRKLDLERGSFLFLPNAALFANLEASGQVPPFSESDWYGTTWSWNLTLGLSANVELFDGGASLARIGEAKSSLLAARAGLEGAEQGSRLELRRALGAARSAEANLAARKARADWTTETLRNAKTSLDDQLISRSEYKGAAILEAGARLEVLSSSYALAEAIADIERLAGKELP